MCFESIKSCMSANLKDQRQIAMTKATFYTKYDIENLMKSTFLIYLNRILYLFANLDGS